jgi:DNA-binding transcriptional LysR family regulator
LTPRLNKSLNANKFVASESTIIRIGDAAMDRFQVIESFVRVAHAGSFTKAARQLGLSRALISRRIIELEDRLGVRLLNRSTRSVSLTAEGRAYLGRCKQVLDEMEAAEREIAQGAKAPLGGIRVLAPKSFGVTCLSDAIIAFSRMHPQIRVSLSLGDFSFRPADFVEEGFDLAIRIADIRDSTVLARRITTLKSVLCASPDFVARASSPRSIADLTHYSCLAHLGSDEHDRIWNFVGQRGGSIRVDGSFDSNSALALRKAALAGLGIALLPEEYIAADLAAGTLIRILPQYEVKRPVTALYARSPHIPQKVRLLVSFLIQWFKQERADQRLPARPL